MYNNNMNTYIKIKTQFVGFHRWKDAPKKVEFLRNWHRHIFGVEVTFLVDHSNRALEFFLTQEKVNKYLKKYENKKFEASCEMIAEDICKKFGAMKVEVSEDGENSGIYLN